MCSQAIERNIPHACPRLGRLIVPREPTGGLQTLCDDILEGQLILQFAPRIHLFTLQFAYRFRLFML